MYVKFLNEYTSRSIRLSIKNYFYSILITQYFFRGDHIVPNFEEIWPSKKGGKNAKPMRGMEYYLDAMENGPQLSGIFMQIFKLVVLFYILPFHNNNVTISSFIQKVLFLQRLFTYSTQLHNCWKTSNYRESVRLATWCVFWWHPRRDEGRTTRDAEPRSGWTYATQEKRQSNGRDASKDIWSVEVWSLRRS